MNADSLNVLLDKLTGGDTAAAEKVFVAYEPYLRTVVRRYLSPAVRAKFDSTDIVQSIWADLLRGFREAGWRFADVIHLRAFLVRLTRHRCIDRLRHYRQAIEREQSLAVDKGAEELLAADPQPHDQLLADELWQEMLTLCSPKHREVLRLKREGAPTSEVASRTGLHEGSVRRILCDLSRRLARRRESGSSNNPIVP